MFQIRIHGRAGQGAKTIAQFLAEAGIKAGKFVQAFPSFGPARTGAPMNAFVRLSDYPINLYSEVRKPDAVLVIDPLLIESEEIVRGLKSGLLLVNSAPEEKIKKQLFRKGLDAGTKIVFLPASKIALAEINKDVPNTVLLGALVGLTEIVRMDDLLTAVKSNKKFDPETTENNLKLIRAGYQYVKEKKFYEK